MLNSMIVSLKYVVSIHKSMYERFMKKFHGEWKSVIYKSEKKFSEVAIPENKKICFSLVTLDERMNKKFQIKIIVEQEFEYDNNAGIRGIEINGHLQESISKKASLDIYLLNDLEQKILNTEELVEFGVDYGDFLVKIIDVILNNQKFEKNIINEKIKIGGSLKIKNSETMEDQEEILFEDLKFFISKGKFGIKRQELESIIDNNGGFTVDDIKESDYIICSEKDIEISNSNDLNIPIIKYSFITNSIRTKKMPSYFDFDNPDYIYNPNKTEPTNIKIKKTDNRPNYYDSLKKAGLLITLGDTQQQKYKEYIEFLKNSGESDEGADFINDDDENEYYGNEEYENEEENEDENESVNKINKKTILESNDKYKYLKNQNKSLKATKMKKITKKIKKNY